MQNSITLAFYKNKTHIRTQTFEFSEQEKYDNDSLFRGYVNDFENPVDSLRVVITFNGEPSELEVMDTESKTGIRLFKGKAKPGECKRLKHYFNFSLSEVQTKERTFNYALTLRFSEYDRNTVSTPENVLILLDSPPINNKRKQRNKRK